MDNKLTLNQVANEILTGTDDYELLQIELDSINENSSFTLDEETQQRVDDLETQIKSLIQYEKQTKGNDKMSTTETTEKVKKDPDNLAVSMKSATTGSDGKCCPKKLAKVAKDNGIDLKKYKHLNVGMQRMNIGNILRSRHGKGEKVKLSGLKAAAAAPRKKAAPAKGKAAPRRRATMRLQQRRQLPRRKS